MWNPDDFMERLYRKAEKARERHADSLRELSPSERKARLKERLRTSLGSFAEWRAPLEPILLERTEYDDYVQERVEIGTLEGLRVPVYVLVPKRKPNGASAEGSRRLPGMLALHGHGYGSREVVGLTPEGEPRHKSGGHNDFAQELAKRGFIVAAPEMIGLGDRRLLRDTVPGKERSSCIGLTGQLMMHGMSLAGLRVFETLRTLDYLASRSEADPDRIGVMGFSGGGTVAAYASALDERIKAAVLCGFTNTYKGSILSINHCIDNYIPGVLEYAELPELIGLIAPRPLFVESGESDPIFPAGTVREAIRELKDIYREVRAESKLGHDIFPGTHEVSGRAAFPWLLSVLGNGGTS